MKEEEYINKRDALFEEWKEARKYDTVNGFTSDGPSDWDLWQNQNPKILFLLKEAFDSFTPSSKVQHVFNPKAFNMNIIRWESIIKNLYENSNANLSFPESDEILKWGKNTTSNIAIVEIKKFDENKPSSNYAEIKRYARNDSEFIKRQIELTNPDIIFCCNTGDFYSDYFFNEDYDTGKPLSSDSKCNCFKDKNRLIIDFYHPSTRNNNRAKELYEILIRLLLKGKVFEKFDWGRKNNNN